MDSRLYIALVMATIGFTALPALAADFTVTVEGVGAKKPIPAQHALCIPSKDGKSGPGQNLRPTLRWSNIPAGTKSFAVFMMDPDVPADFADAGKEGRVIAQDAKRQDFFHYGLVNIPTDVTAVPGGDSITAPKAGTQLVNDLGSYIHKPDMFGGPCPPWNDARLHHYHFIVFALNEAAIDAEGTAKETYRRLNTSAHVLARAESIGTYTLNPALAAK